MWRGLFLIFLIYATVAKTSLRYHNVSLVAASPTRHPGPLYSVAMCGRKKKHRQKISPHSHTKPDLSIISWAAVGFRDSSPSTSLAEGPVSQLRARLPLASCCQNDWSWRSHAAGLTRASIDSVYPRHPHNSGSINITWSYFFPTVSRDVCASVQHDTRAKDAQTPHNEFFFLPPFSANFICVHCGPLSVIVRACVCVCVCVCVWIHSGFIPRFACLQMRSAAKDRRKRICVYVCCPFFKVIFAPKASVCMCVCVCVCVCACTWVTTSLS